MPESGTYGSVRGVPGNGHPYRDRGLSKKAAMARSLSILAGSESPNTSHQGIGDALNDAVRLGVAQKALNGGAIAAAGSVDERGEGRHEDVGRGGGTK